MREPSRSNQRGGANLKFLLVLAIIAGGGFVGYKFIPVAYQSYLFKDLMQHNVNVAATQGYQTEWVRTQLVKSFPEYDIPADASVTPSQEDNRIIVNVQFTKAIEFPGYTYHYQFDHTVKSTAFLSFK